MKFNFITDNLLGIFFLKFSLAFITAYFDKFPAFILKKDPDFFNLEQTVDNICVFLK